MAAGEFDDAVGDASDLAVVGYYENGTPFPCLSLEGLEDLNAGLEVQFACWLVGEEDRVASGEGAGYGDALLFATRELVGEVLGAVGKAHFFQDGGSVRAGKPPGDIDAEFDVLAGSEPGEEVEALEDEANGGPAEGKEVAPAGGGDVPPADDYGACGGGIEGADDVEERGLAAARGTKHDDELAFRHGERDIGEGSHAGGTGFVDP